MWPVSERRGARTRTQRARGCVRPGSHGLRIAPLNFCLPIWGPALNLKKKNAGLLDRHLVFPGGRRHMRVFHNKPTYPTPCLKRRSSPRLHFRFFALSSQHLIAPPLPLILILALPMSPESPSSSSPPKTGDNMRLPAYRASYLGRYHPYPRTRTPAREVVMVCAPCSDF
jgi:hypothetical protein